MASSRASPLQLALPLTADGRPALPAGVLARKVEEGDVERLHRRLGALIGEPLDLVATENRRTLLSWRREAGVLRVRVHRQYALADDATVEALACFVRSRDGQARRKIRDFARRFQREVDLARRPRCAGPLGRAHDLRAHLDAQNRAWFGGRHKVRIGWARATRGRVRRSIRLGSWSPLHRLLRIHPVLDARDVPGFVVGFIVFHELLHAELDARETRGRRVFHTREFREREAAHPDRERAEAWIRENLHDLLSW